MLPGAAYEHAATQGTPEAQAIVDEAESEHGRLVEALARDELAVDGAHRARQRVEAAIGRCTRITSRCSRPRPTSTPSSPRRSGVCSSWRPGSGTRPTPRPGPLGGHWSGRSSCSPSVLTGTPASFTTAARRAMIQMRNVETNTIKFVRFGSPEHHALATEWHSKVSHRPRWEQVLDHRHPWS